MHSLLRRQVRDCTSAEGTLDVAALLERVGAAYAEHDEDRRLRDRAHNLMAEEITSENARTVNQARRDLQRSWALLGSVIDNAPIGIIAKDARDELRISLCNRAAVGLFGFGPSEAIGKRVHELMPPEVAEETTADERHVCETRRTLEKCVRRRSRTGRELVIEKKLIPLLEDSGEVLYVLEIFEDVTEQRDQARRLLEAKDQAEAASRAKSTFLATMSHEIRTPMNGVLGMTSLLLDTVLDDRQRRYAQLIKTSAENLLVILDDVLDMSKIEAGRLSLEETELDLGLVCQAAVDVVRTRADAKGVTLLLDIDADLGRMRRGDPDRVRQLLVNLMGNAVKFTERGSVSVRVAAGSGPDRVRVSVTDTGIGIPQADIGKLFQEFVQVDASATRRFGGTGLGLAICKKLVEMMGGTIGVESEVGKGSTFWFEVPAPVAAQRARGLTRPSGRVTLAPPRRGLRVLVAEDNAINREVIRGYLDWAGCESTLVENGAQALEALRRGAVDLVLMDMQMPVMDGLEATRAIRALEGPPSKVPVVMLTANAMVSDREQSLAAGADEHLPKPVDRSRLLALLTDLEPQADPGPVVPPAGRTTPPPSVPDIDRSQLEELEEVIGHERLTELVAGSRASLEASLERVVEAARLGDRAALGRLAHALIGSASSLGLASAVRAARGVEAACGDETAELGALSEALTASLLRGLRALSALFATSDP